jgi:hypothetical protein
MLQPTARGSDAYREGRVLSHTPLNGRLARSLGTPIGAERVPRAAKPLDLDLPHDLRLEAIAERIALHVESLAPQGRIDCLDLGLGDTTLADAVQQRVARTRWSCLDVLVSFDGGTLPYEDGEFEVAVVCDVLQQAPEDAAPLLAEAARVAGHVVVEVPKHRFTRETFVEIAAQERLVITALDCGLDLYERSPRAGALLQPEWQFIAVLARRGCKKQGLLSKV